MNSSASPFFHFFFFSLTDFVDLKEAESSEVKQPSASYHLSCGKSLWESKQGGADDEAVTVADKDHVLETSINVQPQQMSILVSS